MPDGFHLEALPKAFFDLFARLYPFGDALLQGGVELLELDRLAIELRIESDNALVGPLELLAEPNGFFSARLERVEALKSARGSARAAPPSRRPLILERGRG